MNEAKASSAPSLPHPRPRRTQIYIFVQVLAAAVALVLASLAPFGFWAINHHRETRFLERVDAGKMVVTLFARGAMLPLLERDFLSLNVPFREINYREEFLYAFVADGENLIRAHTDPAQIGSPQRPFENIQSRREQDPISETTYRLPSGVEVLDLSTPVLYRDKRIGTVHLGLSLKAIHKEVGETAGPLQKGMLSWGLLMVTAAAGAAFFLRTRLVSEGIPKDREAGTAGGAPRPDPAGEGSFGFKIASPRSDQGGSKISRKQVTILFGGIKGFRNYAETRDPDAVLKDLNEYFSIAYQNILDHGGYIDKCIGDAVIGIFESLPFQKDHAERAVRAAVAMQRALHAAGRNGNPLLRRIGIGLSSGVVLSGSFENQGDEKHTFIGESFKAAYLLNVMAGPGEITLSQDVYRFIQDLVAVDPLPPLEMNEKTAPWESFRITDILEPRHHE